MKYIFEDLRGYGAKWGCADLYEEYEEALRQSIAKGQPFTTGWYGVNKEPISCKIEFDGISTTVVVSVAIDEVEDLADTLVWRSCGGNAFSGSGYEALEKTFPGSDPEAIMEMVVGGIIDEYQEYTSGYKKVDKLPSYEELLDLVRKIENDTGVAVDIMVASLESVVAGCLAYIKEDQSTTTA